MRREWFWLDCQGDRVEYVHNASGSSLVRPNDVPEVEWAEARASFLGFYSEATRVRRRRVIGSSMPVDFLPKGAVPIFPAGTVLKFTCDAGRFRRVVEGQQLTLSVCGSVPSYLLEGGEVLSWSSKCESWEIDEVGPVFLKERKAPRAMVRMAA